MKNFIASIALMLAIIIQTSLLAIVIPTSLLAQESSNTTAPTANNTVTQAMAGITSQLTPEERGLIMDLAKRAYAAQNEPEDVRTTKKAKADNDKKASMSPEAFAEKYMDKIITVGGTLLTKAEALITQNAPLLWGIVVKQQMIDAMSSLVVGILLILGALIWHLMWKKYPFKAIHNEFSDYVHRTWLVYIIPSIVWPIGALFIFFTLKNDMGRLFNPEYFAMQTIVDYIRQIF
jgi:hypothetical protein